MRRHTFGPLSRALCYQHLSFEMDAVNQVVAFAILVALALILDILTGIFSAPSIMATIVASRVMTLRTALFLATIAELTGPFLFGLAVVNTVASEVVDAHEITLPILYAALIGAIIWTILCWYVRIPTSVSHAQIGGMVGAAIVALGVQSLQRDGLIKILLALTVTVPLSFIFSFILVRLSYFLTQNATPRVNRRFNQGQALASFTLGLAIGSNSAQRTMGIIALGLVITGFLPQFEIPTWVIAISAAGLALGNLLGGRLIRIVGAKFFQLRSVHGFSVEAATSAIVIVTSLLGGPISTTQLTSMAVVGAGSAERLSMVRWGFVQNILLTWVLTIPMTGLVSALVYFILSQLGVR